LHLITVVLPIQVGWPLIEYDCLRDCLRWLLNVAISRNLDLPIQLLFGGLVQAMKEVKESLSHSHSHKEVKESSSLSQV
jgi:hypothetical protein